MCPCAADDGSYHTRPYSPNRATTMPRRLQEGSLGTGELRAVSVFENWVPKIQTYLPTVFLKKSAVMIFQTCWIIGPLLFRFIAASPPPLV